jgi:hypothetical protein
MSCQSVWQFFADQQGLKCRPSSNACDEHAFVCTPATCPALLQLVLHSKIFRMMCRGSRCLGPADCSLSTRTGLPVALEICCFMLAAAVASPADIHQDAHANGSAWECVKFGHVGPEWFL